MYHIQSVLPDKPSNRPLSITMNCFLRHIYEWTPCTGYSFELLVEANILPRDIISEVCVLTTFLSGTELGKSTVVCCTFWKRRFTLQWRQITGVSIVCSIGCLGASQPHVTGLYEGNPPVPGGFPSQTVCIYLNKNLKTLLCNADGFVLPLYICVEWSLLKLKLKSKGQ